MATHDKINFRTWYKRDGLIIRSLVNHGFLNKYNPDMQALREANSRSHFSNNCPEFDKKKNRALKEIDDLIKTRVKMKDKFEEELEKDFSEFWIRTSNMAKKDFRKIFRFGWL